MWSIDFDSDLDFYATQQCERDNAEADWLEQDYIDRHYIVPTIDGSDEDGFLTDDELDAMWAEQQEGL